MKRFDREIVSGDLVLEDVYIQDSAGPDRTSGVGTGVCAMAGEFLKLVNDSVTGKPKLTQIVTSITDQFGGWSPYSNCGFENATGSDSIVPGLVPTDYEGNGYLNLYKKAYPELWVVNVDLTVATCTVTITSADKVAVKIPAGTRVSTADDTQVFAIYEDLLVATADYGDGTTVTFTNVPLRRVLGSTTTGVTLTKCVDQTAILLANALESDDATIVPSAISAITTLDQDFVEAQYVEAIEMFGKEGVDENRINVVWAALLS